jgi:aminoglycoside phosphotransferase (APT) family kinase protein
MRRAGAGLSIIYARLHRQLSARRRMSEAADLLPLILRETAAQTGAAEATDWVLQSIHVSGTHVMVMMVGPPGQSAAAAIKIPTTIAGRASQRREAQALAALLNEPSIREFAALVPGRLVDGEVHGVTYTVERAIQGVEGRVLLDEPSTKNKVVAAAADVAGQLHQATSDSVAVDAQLLQRWVSDRVRLMAAATRNTAGLHRLERLLRRAWEGREVTVSWVHGDFWPANVMFDPAPFRESLQVSGIIDWEWAAGRELPAHDVLYLLMQMRMLANGLELGPVVASLLNGDPLSYAERELLEPSGVNADPETVLIVWLRHIAYNLIQNPGDAHNWVWSHRNIDTVLRLI